MLGELIVADERVEAVVEDSKLGCEAGLDGFYTNFLPEASLGTIIGLTNTGTPQS